MARSYVIVDNRGVIVQQCAAIPLELKEGERVSLRETVIVHAQTHPVLILEEGTATATTNAENLAGDSYQVHIEIIGNNPNDVEALHKRVIELLTKSKSSNRNLLKKIFG